VRLERVVGVRELRQLERIRHASLLRLRPPGWEASLRVRVGTDNLWLSGPEVNLWTTCPFDDAAA